MQFDRARLDGLTADPSYQSIPMQMAIEKGYKVWWSQVGEMTRTAASMCIWEVATALESCFETYADERLDIKMHWTQPRDQDPSGKLVELLVNGRPYQSGGAQMEASLRDRLFAVDRVRALDLVVTCVHSGVLANRQIIADALNEALGQGVVSSAEQARAIKIKFAPEVSARIEAVLMAQVTPAVPLMRPTPRF